MITSPAGTYIIMLRQTVLGANGAYEGRRDSPAPMQSVGTTNGDINTYNGVSQPTMSTAAFNGNGVALHTIGTYGSSAGSHVQNGSTLGGSLVSVIYPICYYPYADVEQSRSEDPAQTRSPAPLKFITALQEQLDKRL